MNLAGESLEMLQYLVEHSVRVLENIIVPETQNSQALLLKEASATCILCGSLVVLAAIQFDD